MQLGLLRIIVTADAAAAICLAAESRYAIELESDSTAQTINYYDKLFSVTWRSRYLAGRINYIIRTRLNLPSQQTESLTCSDVVRVD